MAQYDANERAALIEASPHIGSVRANPYTADEIDALPDEIRARVWATVEMLREGENCQ